MERSVVTKGMLIEAIAKRQELEVSDVRRVVNDLFEMVLDNALNSAVNISGFGKFECVERASRKGRDARSGEPIEIPASTTIKFKVSKTAKERLC